MAARVNNTRSGGQQGLTLGGEAAQAAGAVPHGMLAVEMASDEDVQAGAGAAATLLGQLQGEMAGGDDVVPAHHPLGLNAEDLLEVDAAEGNEGRGGIGGGPGELGVEGGQKAVTQIPVGR